jgi:hypothetical protein
MEGFVVNTLFLKFVGNDGDYKLRSGFIYECKIYTKKGLLWVKAKTYEFPKRYMRIPYNSFTDLTDEWKCRLDDLDNKLW